MARRPTSADEDGALQPLGHHGASETGDRSAAVGRIVPIRTLAFPSPLRHPVQDGGVGTFAMLVADERRQAEDRLLRREAQLNETQRLSRMGTWELDVRSETLTWTAEMFRVFGVRPEEFRPTFENLLAVVHPDDRDRFAHVTGSAYRSGAGFDIEHRVLYEGGEVRWVHGRGKIVMGPDDTPLRFYGTAQDVTDRHRTEELLVHQALHDPLTGLPNRLLFVDRLAQALRRARRQDAVLAVLFIDLDRFKLVNDTHGHAAGDIVLMAMTKRLQHVLRPGDTVARLGGDEFTVLCEDLESAEAILPIAERALAALDAPVLLDDGHQAVVTASIGVAVVGSDATTAEDLLADADWAMYKAKERGRNRLEIFNQTMRADAVTRVEQVSDLRRAVEEGELVVHYQPELRLGDESMAGVEALVRWQHPALGLLGPDQFIGLAEDTGLVVALGAEVLRTACREVASWRPGSGPGAAHVAVNLSARQLVEPGVIDTVWEVLKETGMEPSRLCLEITESVLMEDVASSIEALLGLKALGVRLAIDDFGTGYSSLSYLRRFPVDIVKIDRSFVAGLGVDPAAEAIVAAVVNLAHALGLVVVGEGVETEQQLVMLRALGCDRAQGFLWSRPLPAEQVRQWRPAEATVESTSVDVRAVLEERVAAWQSGTGRAFLMEGPARLPTAQADWGALKTVVDHLLDNAVAFSPADRPVVVSAGAGRRWVRFSVADFGVGMSGEEVARCFEQFWQADVAARSRGGTGIGLSTVRSLVEAMGGKVAVKSATGKGSSFTVSVPRFGRGQNRSTVLAPGVGDPSMVREFMRQIGVPTRRDP